MQCEICGRETSKPTRIILDGSHLAVCGDCSSYGTKEAVRPTFKKPAPMRTESFFEMGGEELVQGYGKAIRKAREQQGWTIEELGKKVFEKASFLHRIEAESVKPSITIIKKLENALGIKIIEREE